MSRFASLYTTIKDEKDAEKVLSDLSIFSYAFGLFLILFSLICLISYKSGHITTLPIIFLLTGYFLPRRKSRVLSLIALILSVILSATALWFFFLHTNTPLFSLGVISILPSLILLLFPLFLFFYSWVAFRNTVAAFIYHRHHTLSKEELTRSILVALLAVIAAVVYGGIYQLLVVKNAEKITPIQQAEVNPKIILDGIPSADSVVISHDKGFMEPNNFGGPTQLDTMDLKQIAAYRKMKIKQYSKLNIFERGYDPLKPPHDKIYGHITPKARWITAVPYYIANPYVLLSLTHANYVAPFTVFLDDVNIFYSKDRILEIHTGNDFMMWCSFLYSQKGNLGVTMVNAWDAGFHYVHLDENKSENIIPATSPDNIGRTVYSQSSFYHSGGNKNNISPYDAKGSITLKNNSSPTKLVFYLWREKPLSLSQKPDLIYEMVFTP